MRYRTGPIAGTAILTVLALLGVVGEITAGFRGQSVGSAIFGLVVIVLLGAVAASGLNDLRGVRTEQLSDGTAVLRLPRLIPNRDGWWRTVAAADVDAIYLVLVGRRSRSYELVVTLHGGTNLRSGAVAVNRPRRVDLADTKAGRMVAQISRDLGISGSR